MSDDHQSWTRRKVLQAAATVTAWCAVPAWGKPARAAAWHELDLPGAARIVEPVLLRYLGIRSRLKWLPCASPGGVRASLDRGAYLWVEPVQRAGASALVSITVETPAGSVVLERGRDDPRVVRLVTHRAEGPSHPGGFDVLRSRDSGLELTFSDDLALRYRKPEFVPGARLPRLYERAAAVLGKDAAKLL